MKLRDYLPGFWDGSAEVLAVQDAISPAVAEAWKARDGLLDQLNVQRATWGLVLWEKALGLPTDVSKDMEYRRTRILSKLRGQGATTVVMIQNVAESFSNGTVEVAEYPAEYRLEIKFTGTIGVPPNMEDLSAALAEIMPAHLDYDYVIIFRTWGQTAAYTWEDLAARTWGEVKEGTL